MPSAEPNTAGISINGSFTPLAALQYMIHFWWFLFLLMVAGGLVGWMIHRARPPLYEAVGQFSASIDFIRTGPMTQFEEDVAFNAIGSLIYSNAVVDQVVKQAGAEGIATSVQMLKRDAVLERNVDTWQLRVRNNDPRLAERLVNMWVSQAQTVLLESYRNALVADQMGRVMQSLESCLEHAAVAEPAGGQCVPSRFTEIQSDLSKAGKAYYEARLASGGLFAGLVLGPVQYAVVSAQPVILGRNQLVMAGCLLGLLAGLICQPFAIPGRWIKRS